MRLGKVFLGALAALSIGGYLVISAQSHGPGFPLDDAWIHHGYARNLALNGEWAFLPGTPSAGATSFLWVILLAAGYAFGLSPYVWTFFLGGLVLWALAVIGFQAAKTLLPENIGWPIFAAGLMLFEWHLVWAAISGMETLLFAMLATVVLTRLIALEQESADAPSFWWSSGFIAGLASLVRPEGLTLLGPVALAALIYGTSIRKRFVTTAQVFLTFAIVIVPYLGFNQFLSGNLWPNTFYAKQAEYSIMLDQPLIERLLGQFSLPLVGVGILLLPGFVRLTYRAAIEKKWAVLLSAAWAIGFMGLYAARLPVTFQHGRYVMPVMPIFFILGVVGLAQLLRINEKRLGLRVLSRAWLAALAVLLLVFWGRGASSYQQDVAFIESEMVVTAEWIDENTDAYALVAAHDIGALGYFSQRPLLDLAGLVSPEVIPFIRDESKLAEYLSKMGAEYLVTFSGWYPDLSAQGQLVYLSEGKVSVEMGGENMAVYRWIVE